MVGHECLDLEEAALLFAECGGALRGDQVLGDAAFPEQESASHVTLRGQGGEEVVIAAVSSAAGETKVTGSTYLFDQQVARFFATLAPVPLAVATEGGE